MTKEEALKIADGTVQELRAQARTSREAYWLNGAADVIEALIASGTPTRRAETLGSVGEADGGPTAAPGGGDAQTLSVKKGR